MVFRGSGAKVYKQTQREESWEEMNRNISISPLTDTEKELAVEVFRVLRKMSERCNGMIQIDREHFMDMVSAWTKLDPYRTWLLVMKMVAYGYLNDVDDHFVVVNVNKEVEA